MEPLVLVIVVGVVLLGLVLLRVPSVPIFFSLLIGNLLVTEVTNEAYEFVSSLLRIAEFRYVQIGLLILPMLLTVLFLRGKVKRAKLAFEAIPNLFVAILLLLLLYPLVPELARALDQITGDKVAHYKSAIVVAASVSGLLSVWLNYPKHGSKGHSKHK